MAFPHLADFVYHESQQFALCGLHAVNSLLQSQYFTEAEFSQFALECDRLEQHIIYNRGDAPIESQNVSVDGNFSIQVIERALSMMGIALSNFSSAKNDRFRDAPWNAVGYLCNFDQHWIALRRFGKPQKAPVAIEEVALPWMNLDSVQPVPKYVGATYLSMLLNELVAQHYTVFVVEGNLPDCTADDVVMQTLSAQSALQPLTAASSKNGSIREVHVVVRLPDGQRYENWFNGDDVTTSTVSAFAESFSGRPINITSPSFIPNLSLRELCQMLGTPELEWDGEYA